MMPAAIMDRIMFCIFCWASNESTYTMESMVAILSWFGKFNFIGPSLVSHNMCGESRLLLF